MNGSGHTPDSPVKEPARQKRLRPRCVGDPFTSESGHSRSGFGRLNIHLICLALLLMNSWPGFAAPVTIVNPSAEINNGIDRTSIPHATFPGWSASGTAQSIHGSIHGGNGAWRMSLNPGAEIHQLTSHAVVTGETFSLRFDAATFLLLPPSITADFYTETTPGSINVVLTKVFAFNTPLTSGYWEGFQLLSGFGEFNARAGQMIGVRLRNTASSGFLSVDNVRLEAFAAPAASTGFTKSWATTADRTWVGAEFWANRLQDWEINGGRLQPRFQGVGCADFRQLTIAERS